MPIKRANNKERDVTKPTTSVPLAPSGGEGWGEGALGVQGERYFTNFFSPVLKRPAGKLALLVCLCFLFSLALAADQKQPNSTIKGFKAPLEYFEPPHELQVKTYLEGTEAEPGTNGIIIHNAKLQTFHEDGSWEMTATAPNCLWDSRQQTVSSPGPMQVLTADEKYLFHHEGVGFVWMQTNSDLFISNNVCTTITPLTNSPTP